MFKFDWKVPDVPLLKVLGYILGSFRGVSISVTVSCPLLIHLVWLVEFGGSGVLL